MLLIFSVGDLKREGNGFLVNLIDSPGHVDFSSEVTAAIRVTDGALLVVDAVSGVSVQTETVLRQALAERVQLTLIINKVDRCILEQQLEPEELYKKLANIISRCNALIATYRSTDDSIYLDDHFNPKVGNVAFASGKLGWAFTLPQFATILSGKANISKEKCLNRLWGDEFFSNSNQKWLKYDQAQDVADAERGFCQLVLQPLYKMLKACEEMRTDEIQTLLSKLEIQIPADKLDKSVLDKRTIMSNVMRRWLPAADAMLHLIVLHLPSPIQAQIYRIQYIYEGPADDPAACGMKACDPDSETMIYISKKMSSRDGARFLCFGRIFSGTIHAGANVRILGPDYHPGSTTDLQIKNVTNVGVMIGDQCVNMASIPAGNVVALSGIDKCLVKTATITTSPVAHSFRVMKFSVSPVVRIAVDARDPADHNKFIEGLGKLVQSDSLVQVRNENGQQVIAAAGELHLEICLKELEKTYARCPLKVEKPIVSYRETILQPSRQTAFTKSSNKLNKFFMRASPLEPGLAEAIESGRISSKQDAQERSRILVSEFGWDLATTKRIWAFGPNDSGSNILVDSTRAVDGLANVQDAIVSAFQWVTNESVLIGEPLYGVRFDLIDVEMHRDSGNYMTERIKACSSCIFVFSSSTTRSTYTSYPSMSLG